MVLGFSVSSEIPATPEQIEQILTMPAGRDMDVWVHRWVIGRGCELHIPVRGEFGSNLDGWYDTPLMEGGLPVPVPKYSKDIAAAWEVVEKLRQRWEYVDIGLDRLLVRVKIYGDENCLNLVYDITEETLPLAICRIALLAVLKVKEL